jgi:hypothetical protein
VPRREREQGKSGGLGCFRGREALGALTLVLWFTHIRMFVFDQEATPGKIRGEDKALYGGWGRKRAGG